MHPDSRPTRRFTALAVALAAAAVIVPAGAQQLPAVGLSAASAQLHQEQGAYPHSPGAADFYGFAVAAGDFNHDGFDDLAAGIPHNDCDVAVWDCGAVQVRFGGAAHPLVARVTLDPNGVGQFGDPPPEPAKAFDAYGEALAVGDFNHDGHDDLAIGVPGNEVQTDNKVDGGVHVHYGLAGSLGSIQWVAEHFLAQGIGGVPEEDVVGVVVVENRFGHALAAGDFNGDGHDDLAMAAPRAQVAGGSLALSGNVVVAHGHIGGLVPFEGFLMKQGLLGLPDVPEDDDEFGYALVAGDFNGDGFDDLAIGVPGEDEVGAVLVVYGSPFSLIFPNHQFLGHFDLGGLPQPGGRFGDALAVGDFDADGFDDLVAAASKYDGGNGAADIGLVSVVFGSAGGLVPSRTDWLFEDALHGSGTSEAFDNFGQSLATGDFNADGVDDLAIGTAGENAAYANEGAVSIVLGRRQQRLLGGTARKLFPRGVPSSAPSLDLAGMIPDHQQGDPFWGFSLASGDFDGNGFADLAIGAPSRNQTDPQALTDSGAVAVVYGQLFIDGFETGKANEWSFVIR